MKNMKNCLLLIIFVFFSLSIINIACQREDLYTIAQNESKDILSPTPDNPGSISVVIDSTNDQFVLSWEEATDEVTPQADLIYEVYMFTSSINTLYHIDHYIEHSNLEPNVSGNEIYLYKISFAGFSENTSYFFNVVVKDMEGNRSAYDGCSAFIPDTTLPTVSITYPSNTSTVSGSVTITADASDIANGVIASVAFYVDGIYLSSDTSSPYTAEWDTSSLSGSHTLMAMATDSATPGHTTESAAIDVIVNNLSTDKDITVFRFSKVDNSPILTTDVTATFSGTNIYVIVPNGTLLTSLKPTISHTGASVSPASGIPQDFSDPVNFPVIYTVTASDSTTKVYTVTVTVSSGP